MTIALPLRLPATTYRLQVASLVAGYAGKALLRDLSFGVPGPAFVAVLGHNGSGKTTLFRVLTGQLPYAGSVQLAGHEVRDRAARPAGAAALGYLPQRGAVEFSIPVQELALMGRYRHHGLLSTYSSQDYELTARALHRVGIAHLAERDFRTLSGGEQQLVWLAQLSLQDAAVYLLDEPTQQLDVYHRRRVFELVTSWVAAEGKTVLCSTHDLDSLLDLEGFLLNLSRPQPVLLPLSAATVRKEKAFLEAGPRAG